ncbi:lysylphosphatidylglycerol synthase domain-containing protein [Pseudoduganella violacea]|uniref:Flippase-like domain-containing protein n=1 Tax=Pseudoduganella violacea TaxID=1715466 RepID=A0A7W5B8A6_9BURK|nr:lysylphosphatidylglycerol synthase domain-containing protein [Pseudoduganella violacea]MBB3118045.1 hypothetical protein [Pseudoduganella violacea]
MNRTLRIYLLLLAALVLLWAGRHWSDLGDMARGADLLLLSATALYGLSHLFRMLRLVLLTLDQRDKAFALSAAHALTAFPSSFLPFKIGEILRLAALFHVFDFRRKAGAVWLAERFGDVVVIALFILGLYLFDVRVPAAMRTVFFFFVLASLFGLLAMFAVAKTFVYLNRHLVLVSHSRHGLWLLRVSHALRQLELDIYRSVEGRLTGLLLLSVLIWSLEIAALSLFLNRLGAAETDFSAMFAAGLLASLPGGGAGAFGQYQSLALVALTLLFLAALSLAARMRLTRS